MTDTDTDTDTDTEPGGTAAGGRRGAGAVRPLVVIDAGGVLVGDPTAAAVTGGTWPGRLWAAAVTAVVARRFYAGQVGERTMTALLGAERMTRMRDAGTEVLVDVGDVAAIAAVADVWVLSNHRQRWLAAALETSGLAGHVDRVLVSERLGVAKPDPAVFRIATRLTRPGQAVVYVDDRTVNRFVARRFGWTVLAAGAGWPARLADILAGDETPAS